MATMSDTSTLRPGETCAACGQSIPVHKRPGPPEKYPWSTTPLHGHFIVPAGTLKPGTMDTAVYRQNRTERHRYEAALRAQRPGDPDPVKPRLFAVTFTWEEGWRVVRTQ